LAAVDPTNPQTWNRYAYVKNNPLSLIDPLGLEDCASNPYQGACNGPGGGDAPGGGGGGGGGSNWNFDPCGSYCAPALSLISFNWELQNAAAQALGVYLSCLSYNFQCDANGNYYNPNYLAQANGQYNRLSGNLANVGSGYSVDATNCDLIGGHCNFAFTCDDWSNCGPGRYDDGVHIENVDGALWVHDDTVSPWTGQFTFGALFTGNFWEHGFVDLIGGTFFVGAFPQ
jgi:hypothetical protein